VTGGHAVQHGGGRPVRQAQFVVPAPEADQLQQFLRVRGRIAGHPGQAAQDDQHRDGGDHEDPGHLVLLLDR
jgi:hypothetical protein